MELKEFTVSVKLTKNYDSYSITETYTVEPDEEPDYEEMFKIIESKIESYIFLKGLSDE